MNRTARRLYQMKAEMIRAVGHPIRLAIIDFLKDGEQCVCDIARCVDSQRSNVSRHLAVMLKAGILECRKDGLRVMYGLKTPCVARFLNCVSDALRERFRRDSEVLKRI